MIYVLDNRLLILLLLKEWGNGYLHILLGIKTDFYKAVWKYVWQDLKLYSFDQTMLFL